MPSITLPGPSSFIIFYLVWFWFRSFVFHVVVLIYIYFTFHSTFTCVCWLYYVFWWKKNIGKALCKCNSNRIFLAGMAKLTRAKKREIIKKGFVIMVQVRNSSRKENMRQQIQSFTKIFNPESKLNMFRLFLEKRRI